MKEFEEEIVDNDEILNIVDEIEIIVKEDRYNNNSTKDLKKDYPDKTEKMEEALLNFIGKKDLKNLKTEFPANKWKYSTKKLAYPYDDFNSPDDYQKPVDNLKEENFFQKIKK